MSKINLKSRVDNLEELTADPSIKLVDVKQIYSMGDLQPGVQMYETIDAAIEAYDRPYTRLLVDDISHVQTGKGPCIGYIMELI